MTLRQPTFGHGGNAGIDEEVIMTASLPGSSLRPAGRDETAGSSGPIRRVDRAGAPSPEARLFVQCGTCLGLYGTWGGDRQVCGCCTADERADLRAERGDAWIRLAALCACCGAEFVPATHPFSSWFCTTCRKWADQVNRAAKTCAIPIGWHSVVNGVYVKASTCRTDAGATWAADQLGAHFREAASIHQWSTALITADRERVGLEQEVDIVVTAYLDLVWDAGVDKEERFRALALGRGVPRECLPRRSIELDAKWKRISTGHFEAEERVVWLEADGTSMYRPLRLLVRPAPGGSQWVLSLGADTSTASEPVGEGSEASPTEARRACEQRAIDLILHQESMLAERPLPAWFWNAKNRPVRPRQSRRAQIEAGEAVG